MKNKLSSFLEKYPKIRKALGIFLVIVGIISILTPFTPLGILFFVGLEFLGMREALLERLKNWFK